MTVSPETKIVENRNLIPLPCGNISQMLQPSKSEIDDGPLVISVLVEQVFVALN